MIVGNMSESRSGSYFNANVLQRLAVGSQINIRYKAVT